MPLVTAALQWGPENDPGDSQPGDQQDKPQTIVLGLQRVLDRSGTSISYLPKLQVAEAKFLVGAA